MSDNTSGPFSAKEQELLWKAWSCTKDKLPPMDWDKLAAMSGYTNPRSAANAFRAAMKKVDPNYSAATTKDTGVKGGTPKKSGSAKTTPKKAASAIKDEVDDEDELGDDKMPQTPKTPTKKNGGEASVTKAADLGDSLFGDEKKPRTPSGAKRSAENAEDNEEEALTPAKKKRTPTKREPKVDEEGNPITPKRAPRKKPEPKLDENGNPVTPKRAPRGKKATASAAASTAAEKKDDAAQIDAFDPNVYAKIDSTASTKTPERTVAGDKDFGTLNRLHGLRIDTDKANEGMKHKHAISHTPQGTPPRKGPGNSAFTPINSPASEKTVTPKSAMANTIVPPNPYMVVTGGLPSFKSGPRSGNIDSLSLKAYVSEQSEEDNGKKGAAMVNAVDKAAGADEDASAFL